jgi:phosphotransferase system enzyme I (PtsI)
MLEGIAGSPGLAIGRATVIDTRRPRLTRRHIHKHGADDELARFDQAVAASSLALREVHDKLKTGSARAESSILEAYILMVEDESLRDEVERHIRIDHQCAEWALDNAVREMAAKLRSAENPYLAERSHDFEFVADRIMLALAGKPRQTALPAADEPRVVVAHDLSPAETAGFTKDRVLALVTEVGTRTSHTAILARALEIPAVVGVRDVLACIGTGDRMVVDGSRGRVILSPTDEMVLEAEARAERHRRFALGLRGELGRPTTTSCGVAIDLRANIELPTEAELAVNLGAAGIGLYRTEFLYVDRAVPPSEDEQYETYRHVLEVVAPRPVTLRTFDIGGDKFVSAFQVPADMNPALGLRAVRLALARPEIFLVQLRAMVRASAHGKLRVMIPMIASLSELREVSQLFQRAIAEVDRAGRARAAHIPLGVMVEVPSAAIMADELAREAEFLSVGTNDLVQYALAVDRTNPKLTHLASAFDPSILRLLRIVVTAGEHHSRDVSVCGTMASDPLAATLLVGMGVRCLSLEAAAIPKVKAALARFSVAEAASAAQRAFEFGTADEVERAIVESLGARIADLLDSDA